MCGSMEGVYVRCVGFRLMSGTAKGDKVEARWKLRRRNLIETLQEESGHSLIFETSYFEPTALRIVQRA